MGNLVVVGLQWGDEGKGKIVDVLSENFDVVTRFQGGSNAGHTVIIGSDVLKFRFNPGARTITFCWPEHRSTCKR